MKVPIYDKVKTVHSENLEDQTAAKQCQVSNQRTPKDVHSTLNHKCRDENHKNRILTLKTITAVFIGPDFSLFPHI